MVTNPIKTLKIIHPHFKKQKKHLLKKKKEEEASVLKNLPAKQETQVFALWVGKLLWRRKGQPSPGFFAGESHGQRHLRGYIPES